MLVSLIIWLFLHNSLPAPIPQPVSATCAPPAIKIAGVSNVCTKRLWGQDGAYYSSFVTRNGVRVNVVSADIKSGHWQLKPVANSSLTPTTTTARSQNASASVNGGFFDMSTGDSVSYIAVDGQEVKNPPRSAHHSTRRDDLAPYRQAIASRSEIRVLVDQSGRQSIAIARHGSAIPAGYRLLHALQGGPQLLPVLTSRQEAFIRKDRWGNAIDSIDTTSRAGRTALGITADGLVLLVTAEGPEQGGSSAGMTLTALAKLMSDLDCVIAVNLDGGHSTTMYVRLATSDKTAGSPYYERTVCAAHPQRAVKTVLVLLPVTSANDSKEPRR
jgi:hypothetical protein